MVRFCVFVWFLTSVAACGATPAPPTTPTSAPAPPPPVRLPPPPPSAPPVVVEPPVAESPPPPPLSCDAGTELGIAPAPEPTWFCAKPDGTRHGPFITLFPDRTPEVIGAYQDGLIEGDWQRRATSGAIVETGSYAAGQKTGTWRMTSTLGAPLGEYAMRNGTGTERFWLDDGSLYSERALKAGVPHGPERVYAPDGTVLLTAQWNAGKLDGIHGMGARTTLRIDETLANGVRRGNRQIWLFLQLLLDENFDRQGRRDGEYTTWRSKKVMRVHGQYEHGQREGLWTWNDRDDKQERVGNYVAGKRQGPWTESVQGKIVFSGNYTAGKPDGEFIYYDRNENEIGRFDIASGTGTMLTFWPNRKIASRQRILKGAAQGVYQELTPTGKVVVEGRFRGDVKDGAWREWTAEGVPTLEQGWKKGKLDGAVKKFVDGKLASQATYRGGKAHGPYTEYRGGKPSLTGQFQDDRRTGTWTQYDTDGRVLLTASYKDGVLDGMWRQTIGTTILEGTLTQGRRIGTWTRTEKTGDVRPLTYHAP